MTPNDGPHAHDDDHDRSGVPVSPAPSPPEMPHPNWPQRQPDPPHWNPNDPNRPYNPNDPTDWRLPQISSGMPPPPWNPSHPDWHRPWDHQPPWDPNPWNPYHPDWPYRPPGWTTPPTGYVLVPVSAIQPGAAVNPSNPYDPYPS